MKYTQYFGLITKEKGIINVSIPQFKRMMNIIHVEGVISGLNKAREANKDTPDYDKFYMIIFREGRKLTDLTGNLTPELLLKEMLRFSD